MSSSIEILFSVRALLAECPLWLPEEQRLYFLDIDGLRLHRFDPQSGYAESFPLPNKTGCIVPCRNGNFLIAAQTGIHEIRLHQTGIETLRHLAHPEQDHPQNRYNDGKCAPDGRFFIGSINALRKNEAALYVLDGDSTTPEHTQCRKVIDGAANSNGLGWSPDGETFYWIDTPTRQVEAFDYAPQTGALSNRRTAFAFEADSAWGRPDGMTVDADGMIWVAHWLGGRITRWNPKTGQLLETVFVPAARVTSLCFGGEHLDTLFITTASCVNETAEERSAQSDAGGIFAYRPQTPGLPVCRFADEADGDGERPCLGGR